MHVHRFVKTATLILGVVALFGGSAPRLMPQGTQPR